MTVSMIARHKVNDFATWKKGYDGSAQMLKDGGIIGDWRNQFSAEQNQRFDQLYTQKMSGSNLQFNFGDGLIF